jgi:hypothetical protein
VDPRRHGKRPLPADEEEEEPPSAAAAKHEQDEEYPTTFSGGGSSSSVAPHAGPSPEAYAQYYLSARADQDASAVASALAHVIRASPEQQLNPPHQGFVYPAPAAPVEQQQAAEEEQGTSLSIHPWTHFYFILVLCAHARGQASARWRKHATRARRLLVLAPLGSFAPAKLAATHVSQLITATYYYKQLRI